MSDATTYSFHLGGVCRTCQRQHVHAINTNLLLQRYSCSARLDTSSPLYLLFLHLPRGIFYLLCLLFTNYLYLQLSQTQRTLGSI